MANQIFIVDTEGQSVYVIMDEWIECTADGMCQTYFNEVLSG